MKSLVSLFVLLCACDPVPRHEGMLGGVVVGTPDPFFLHVRVPISVNGKEVTALVDTGASCVAPLREASIVARIGIGALSFHDLYCAPSGTGAIVGNDVLRHFAVTYDFVASSLTLSASPVVGEGSPSTITQAGGVPYASIGRVRTLVHADIEGRAVTLVLDTGAEYNWLRHSLLGALGLDGRTALPSRVTFPFISRTPIAAYAMRLRSQRIGDAELTGVVSFAEASGDRVLSLFEREMDTHIDGLVGAAFLRAFRVTVDAPAGKMYLARHETPLRDAFVRIPIEIDSSGDRFFIVGAFDEALEEHIGLEVTAIDGVALLDMNDAQRADALTGREGEVRVVSVRDDDREWTLSLVVRDVVPLE